MLERAIENWLTNTNERSYQLAFCHVLIREGHKVLHVSSHRSLEQGKDIITIDSEGQCCAYQLKIGDINIPAWRNIREEVRELMELPVVHPSVDKVRIHKSFLVTNGEIGDEVRVQIDQMNDDNVRKNRNYPHLNVINGRVLLKAFIDAQGEFMPRELEDFHLFLEMFLCDGRDFFMKEKFFSFVNHTIFGSVPKQKREKISAITSSVIITAYLLRPYQLKANYFALFEAWTSLAACIVRYVLRASLEPNEWKPSFTLIMSEIQRNLQLLVSEMEERENYLEGDWVGDGDKIYRARLTLVLGTWSALELYLMSTKQDYSLSTKLSELIRANFTLLHYWGESAFPYWFSIIKFLEAAKEISASQTVLMVLLQLTTVYSSPNKNSGIPSPYYSVTDSLEVLMRTGTTEIDTRQFSGGSHILQVLVHMFARRGLRAALEARWRGISHILLKEFVPENAEDIFVWRTPRGVNHSRFFESPQSWSTLCNDATVAATEMSWLQEHKDLLRFFILVAPHRATKSVMAILDNE